MIQNLLTPRLLENMDPLIYDQQVTSMVPKNYSVENWEHPQTVQVERIPHSTASHKHRQHLGGKYEGIEYGANLELRNRTKEKKWYIEDNLDILIYPDPGIHPELAADFP